MSGEIDGTAGPKRVLTESSIGRFDRFVPRVLLQRLALAPDVRVEQLDGTGVFVDVSGFTRLSERLARAGREGAEQLVDAIDSCFSPLLADAYAGGGSLLKFGGDGMLIWFGGEGHALRACGSAVAMRRKLRRVGRVPVGDRHVVLRMSVGIHTGAYESFLVGESHREHVIAGPAATTVVGMEALAETGQILISEATAALLPDRCLGRRRGPGVVLARAPAERSAAPAELPARPADDAVAACLSTQLRAHVASAPATPEHRLATVAFLQFGALDGLLRDRGADAAADALERTVCAVQAAADRFGICFLGSDVAAGGGKIMLSAGAPRAAGDDEERMLLALRQVVEDEPPLPVRIGVNRGSVFAGEVGPHYRRTYTVMGDTVNLAARLMAKAPPGRVYCTAGVLERSSTSFETTALDPFWVKGKAKAVQAWEVGRGRRARSAGPARPRLPLIGRGRELAALEEALAGARAGHGALIELVGETGSGKSRLLSESRARAADMRFVHTTCEVYTQETPYVAWRDPLRQLLGLTWADADEIVLDRLRAGLDATDPELLPWLPLLGIAIDADAPPTREVAELAAEYRAAKLHEVVLRLLSGALKVPTLVQIEHAHLMDDASAALLGALAMVIGTSAWVVIATRRDMPQGFAADADEHRRVELGPLSREDALALAEASPEAEAVPPHLVAQAVERAGGSPEFLLDLLAAAAGGSVSLPDSIDAAASARIDALDAGDRTLVRRAAVLGVSFHPRRLRDVLAPEDPEPDERTWERLSSLFARDPDGHVRFKRPALREVAYEGLPYRVRRRLHAAVAESLESERGQHVDADPAVLSLHFILAGDHLRAHRYALIGAERATARFAHADAARLYRRAIETARVAGVGPAELATTWERLGGALQRIGEPKAASAALTNARRLVRGSSLDEARLHYRHARIAERSGRLPAEVRWIRRGLRVLDGVDGTEAQVWRARLISALAGVRQLQGRAADAERLCRSAIAAAERAGETRALAVACNLLDWALVEQGRPAEATNSPRALAIYRRLGDPEQESVVLNNLGMYAYFRGDWDAAVDLYSAAALCSDRSGNVADGAYTDCNVGEILSDQGHLEQAAIHLGRARRVWSSTGDEAGVAFVDLLSGRLAVRRGQRVEGIALLESAASSLARMRVDGDAHLAQALIAEAEALDGDPARAIEIARRLLAGGERSAALLHRVYGTALARLGDLVGAAFELDRSLRAARARGADYEIVSTLDVLDRLDRRSGVSDPVRTAERDALLMRLRIERMPEPALGAGRSQTDRRIQLESGLFT